MNISRFTALPALATLVIGLVGCGGGEDPPPVTVVKLMARSSEGAVGREPATQSIARELAALQANGVNAGPSRCAMAQTNMPAFSYYLAVEVPADQVQRTADRGFRRAADLVGGEATLITLNCADM